MKKSTRIVFAALCLILAAPTLFAGGGSQQQKGSSSEVTKIRVWTDNASEKDIRMRQIEKFNAGRGKDLGIEIEYTVFGVDYWNTLRVAFMADEAPDLCKVSPTFIFEFINGGSLVPVDDFPGAAELIAQYKGDLIINQHVINGKTYAFPYTLTTFKMLVNKDLFDAAGITRMPTTWEEVREDAKIITQKGKGQSYGYIISPKSEWPQGQHFVYPNAANTGHIGFDHQRLQWNFSAFRPAVEAVMGMVNDGSMFVGYEAMDADQARAQFAAGRVGMIMAASFDLGQYRDAAFNWVVVAPPAFTSAGLPYKEFAEAQDLLGFTTTAKANPEKAMEVFKFFYSDENLAEIYEAGLYIPFRSQAIALAKNPPTVRGFAEFANLPQMVLMLPIPDSMITVEGNIWRETLNRLFTKGYRDNVATVLADLDKRHNEALKQLTKEELESFRASPDWDTKRK
jgi:multiple sugar transport system substrate-binding protein